MQLKEILDRFFEQLHTKRVSAHTMRAYRGDLFDYLKHLSEWSNFGTEKICEVGDGEVFDRLINATSIDLRNYREYLGKSAPATIVRKFATLKKFLSWSLVEGLRQKPVPPLPILPRKQNLAPRWLTKNEINELLRKAERSSQFSSHRNNVIINLFLNTGIRVSELVALKWIDIELGRYDGSLKVRSGKGQKERVVPLNATIRSILREFKECSDDSSQNQEYLFYGKRGKIKEEAVLKVFYVFCKNLSFKVTPHDLRHTFCKSLLERDVSIDKIAALAGHSSLNITQRYLTPSLQDLSIAVGKLNEL